MKRVVITGAGTVNALGRDVAATLGAMQRGDCAIGPLVLRDLERLSIKIGAQVTDWPAETLFNRSELALFDRATQFAVIAAREAMAASGLALSEDEALRCGVILGNAGGGMGTIDDCFRAVYAEGKARVHPLTVPRLMNSAAASNIGIAFGLMGPTFTVSTACASSNHAMGLAFQMVRSGVAPVMLTGGTEAMLTFGGIKAWEGLRVMSPDGCRPFSADRNGMVQGEGAAVFVFEAHDHAIARGATILAEVVGFAMTADAQDIVMPSQQGAARAMAGALADAAIAPETVGYINAHGTGTAANDRTECAAIAQVFGTHAQGLMVSSTKSMHGHLIGGTGAVELLACILALRDGIIAPTIGHRVDDPDCPLDVVPNQARQARVDVALSNSFAFGGLNAVLALRRAE
jgi:nodulation protein E